VSGADHDLAFVKRLLGWQPVLKTVTINFDPSADDELRAIYCNAREGTKLEDVSAQHHLSPELTYSENFHVDKVGITIFLD